MKKWSFTITFFFSLTLLPYCSFSQEEGDEITFVITQVKEDTLSKNGQPILAGETTLAPGEELVWLPDAIATSIPVFAVKVRDGKSLGIEEVEVNVSVENDLGVNEPSTLKFTANQSYTEDITLDLERIIVNDPDSTGDITITLSLSDKQAGTLNSTVTNDATVDFSNGVLTVNGNLTDINAILANIP